ncbi:hypothetical protein KOW79_008510 [Hemibagrus wyckioides]|uniref:Uncharacterized protein n=1 Tax=Hemibagrus wyckioides TaxID=337641 RepID=A0A9D3SL14_9TELE|nr:hypothetical protein KOW79_008510 [Hemibagrus wyckioides]
MWGDEEAPLIQERAPTATRTWFLNERQKNVNYSTCSCCEECARVPDKVGCYGDHQSVNERDFSSCSLSIRP